MAENLVSVFDNVSQKRGEPLDPAPVMFTCHEASQQADGELKARVTVEVGGEERDMYLNGREAHALAAQYDEFFKRNTGLTNINTDVIDRYTQATYQLGRVQSEILQARIQQLNALTGRGLFKK